MATAAAARTPSTIELGEMAVPLRPASPQKRLSAPPSPPPRTPTSSNDTHPAIQPLEASVNDITVPVVAEAPDTTQDAEDYNPARPGIPTAITRRLYISHFISTWNSRSFEFGAVLFLASIFPLTLLPLSIYALVRSASAILFAPMTGRAIDRRSRLPVVRFSIGKFSSFAVEQTLCMLHGIQKEC